MADVGLMHGLLTACRRPTTWLLEPEHLSNYLTQAVKHRLVDETRREEACRGIRTEDDGETRRRVASEVPDYNRVTEGGERRSLLEEAADRQSLRTFRDHQARELLQDRLTELAAQARLSTRQGWMAAHLTRELTGEQHLSDPELVRDFEGTFGTRTSPSGIRKLRHDTLRRMTKLALKG